jgi:hypothetical protein
MVGTAEHTFHYHKEGLLSPQHGTFITLNDAYSMQILFALAFRRMTPTGQSLPGQPNASKTTIFLGGQYQVTIAGALSGVKLLLQKREVQKELE